MIDAVLSYHLNPQTCGVAKFNQQLAQKLGVPFDSFTAFHRYQYPLVSIKHAEMLADVDAVFRSPFDLFLHDWHDSALVHAATNVYAANQQIARRARDCGRQEVIEAFCPSTLQGNPTRAPLNVLTFGMAHKLQLPYYEKLKTLLDGSGQDYTVSVSTAVHEGSPWDAVSEAGEKLRQIFGGRTRVLGYLADDALAKELRDCSMTAMFFDPALRANNTTFWASLDAGAPVITNRDADSPFVASTLVADIDALDAFPLSFARWRAFPDEAHTWDALLQTLGVSVSV